MFTPRSYAITNTAGSRADRRTPIRIDKCLHKRATRTLKAYSTWYSFPSGLYVETDWS